MSAHQTDNRFDRKVQVAETEPSGVSHNMREASNTMCGVPVVAGVVAGVAMAIVPAAFNDGTSNNAHWNMPFTMSGGGAAS